MIAVLHHSYAVVISCMPENYKKEVKSIFFALKDTELCLR